MSTKAAARAEAQRLFQMFQMAGAVPVEADILQPADTLLDLYGEDIRARAFVTADPLRGEQMLRPDFTVPVVQMHMDGGAEPARYTYMGEVFRKQEAQAQRASEYLQVGYEVFDGSDPARADAEVFALMATAVAGLNLRAVTGDVGFLKDAVAGLSLSEARKAALARHIWRPQRFKALLDRFAVPALLREELSDLEGAFASAGPLVGLRSRAEIEARVSALRAEASEAPLSAEEVGLIDTLLGVTGPASEALVALKALAVDMPSIKAASARLEARLGALQARGVDVQALAFETGFGRTLLEYYDGFVFGFYAEGSTAPISSGGRYDALTEVLGAGRFIPAVGGVVRPEMVLEVRG